jgi:hypothetical protein
MAPDFTCLVIGDESAEFPAALHYAAWFVKANGGRLSVLRVVDVTTDHAHWVSVGEEIRAEAFEAAEDFVARIRAELAADVEIEADFLIREGESKAEIRRLIDEDTRIRLVVLASGSGGDGPGPLVSGLARGHGLAARAVPILVVPGTLTREELKELAAPAQPPEPPAA